ncbi:hypothetical protein TRFO_26034 [Tritrichomonas foetus]|uniref:Uncharacterized protein n=1 Tax=Tritrichomonas foetus TaxID=1144522 RepID=A0A1J4K4S7_9EUKA|nr:hypothetical protein TRFO_26034 [Tritrichomonas foetus]|eukprot:OHT05978.1 hypothetical protein TRFO_26034 [Tritrichomonas foetus]
MYWIAVLFKCIFLKMDHDELLDNIRADFFTEVCPFFSTPRAANYENLQKMYNSARFINSVMNQKLLFNCATMVERNYIEFILVNLAGKKANYEMRLYIRFFSAAAASSLTAIVWKQTRNPFSVITVPLIDGALSTVALMIQHPSETDRLLKKKCPNVIKFLEKNCYLREIKDFSMKINNFVYRPKKKICDIAIPNPVVNFPKPLENLIK